MRRCTGVLALQGDFAAHRDALSRAGAPAREVRRPADLAGLTHLVLPGGESTTLRLLLDRFGLTALIEQAFHAGELVLFGTCAGAILLAREAGGRPPTLGLIDLDVERNAYGTQLDSFSTVVRLEETSGELRGAFIRAPRITRVGAGVRVLARHEGDPVLVEAERVLAATFHPELGTDLMPFERFLASEPSPGI